MPASSLPAMQPAPRGAGDSMSALSAGLLQAARRGGRAVGAMFFAVFGGVWLLVGCQLADWHGWLSVAVVLTIALIMVLTAVSVVRKRRDAMRAFRQTAEGRRMRRQFRAINVVQWVLVISAVYLLYRFKLDAWTAPAIMLIVGLHFLPLARVFRQPAHYLTGVILVVTALVYPILSPGGPVSPIGCLIAGIILWLGALWALRPSPGAIG